MLGRIELILAAMGGIVGCAPRPGDAPVVAGTNPSAGGASRPVFATEIAGPSTFLAPMPTAVVVLKPGDLNRNRAFCQAFVDVLPTAQQARAASVVAPNLVLTRWLTQLPEVPPERATDCDFLVGTYDYARAQRLIGALRLTGGQATGPGPFLMMVVADGTGLHAVGLDESSYASANFGRFVGAWGSALQQTDALVSHAPDEPGLVRSVVNLVTAILRVAAGGAAGLIQGVVSGL